MIQSTIITAIATQGRHNLAQWVTSYTVSFSNDAKIFWSYTENDGAKKVNVLKVFVTYHILNLQIMKETEAFITIMTGMSGEYTFPSV